MKRLILLLPILLLLPVTSFCFEAVGSFGYGWLMQDGQQTVKGYYAGAEAPIVTEEGVGYSLVTTTNYFYSDFSTGEIHAMRVMLSNKKTLFAKSGIKGYLGIGSGFWSFIRIDGEDPQVWASQIEAGAVWKKFDLNLGIDIVHGGGENYLFPSVGLALRL